MPGDASAGGARADPRSPRTRAPGHAGRPGLIPAGPGTVAPASPGGGGPGGAASGATAAGEVADHRSRSAGEPGRVPARDDTSARWAADVPRPVGRPENAGRPEDTRRSGPGRSFNSASGCQPTTKL
ncbi:hypothetical protein DP939_22650 [Spongiactinospora rosea]|uniref:Uncharacterized protein n=1 Tax=Spongiactinospora rosea TaxID=2248750 RepID=A0A366LUN9_9ACTN|nr:hypothetical protein DP939_22650 [Spongiactinospora rosea]